MTSLPVKIVRTDAELEMPRVDAALREAGARLVLLPGSVGEAELVREVADADLLLMCYTPITAAVIATAIDIAAARVHGIPVVNVPRYAEETVAEGAFFLMLALAKRMKPLQRAMEQQGWAWPEGRWLGHDLAGKTLGLVGVGHIGRSMARMAAAFRMRVLGYDPHVANLPVERRDDLGSMVAECDVVSVHCVLNEETRHLIGDAELRRMRPTAFLINVSRGEIVDEQALLRALQQGRIAAAALDVYGREPLDAAGHPLAALYAMDNVVLWPHLTFHTHEAICRLEDETLARCFEALGGQPLTVRSLDPRLRAQERGVRFVDEDEGES
jgi:D-3-phosphoglycerate dehydrogenase